MIPVNNWVAFGLWSSRFVASWIDLRLSAAQIHLINRITASTSKLNISGKTPSTISQAASLLNENLLNFMGSTFAVLKAGFHLNPTHHLFENLFDRFPRRIDNDGIVGDLER